MSVSERWAMRTRNANAGWIFPMARRALLLEHESPPRSHSTDVTRAGAARPRRRVAHRNLHVAGRGGRAPVHHTGRPRRASRRASPRCSLGVGVLLPERSGRWRVRAREAARPRRAFPWSLSTIFTQTPPPQPSERPCRAHNYDDGVRMGSRKAREGLSLRPTHQHTKPGRRLRVVGIMAVPIPA